MSARGVPLGFRVEYTVGQVAALFGVNRMTVRRWIHRGELRAHKRGAHYRVTLAALRDNPDLWDALLMKRDASRRKEAAE